MYHLNKALENGNTYWKCEKRRSESGCEAKVVLDQKKKLKIKNKSRSNQE